MHSDHAAALLEWLDQATALLKQWEEQAVQQFAALAQGDLAATVAVSAQQAQLAEQLYHLEDRWRRLSACRAAGEEIGAGAAVLSGRREFEAAAERVFAANYRNLKALNCLDLMGRTLAPAAGGEPGDVYDRRGLPGGQRTATRRKIDRQG